MPAWISIHALLAESDGGRIRQPRRSRDFYPRSPCGERHSPANTGVGDVNFYPRSPCGERHDCVKYYIHAPEISIHALLAESDIISPHSAPNNGNFYPRSPCGERRKITITVDEGTCISIHALLAESDTRRASRQQPAGISIHALLAESDNGRIRDAENLTISIHALLAESDTGSLFFLRRRKNFYPRSPCGERPTYFDTSSIDDLISIHALLAESDNNGRIRDAENLTISIHALLAESDSGHDLRGWVRKGFLSTLSLRRATDCVKYYIHAPEISIHALLAESDRTMTTTICTASKFLSTLSLRRATWKRFPPTCSIRHFYPRSPCGERPHYDNYNLHCVEISIHALLAESDPGKSNKLAGQNYISIHALLAESDLKQSIHHKSSQ